jgi:hypothetical protein
MITLHFVCAEGLEIYNKENNLDIDIWPKLKHILHRKIHKNAFCIHTYHIISRQSSSIFTNIEIDANGSSVHVCLLIFM